MFLVKVSFLDRDRLGPRNVLGIVLKVHLPGMYQIGTKEDILEHMHGLELH